MKSIPILSPPILIPWLLFPPNIMCTLLLTQTFSGVSIFTGVIVSTGAWAVPQKKSNSISFRSHQFQVDPQIGVWSPDSILHICWDYGWLDFVQILCVQSSMLSSTMFVAVLSGSENTVFLLISTSSGLTILPPSLPWWLPNLWRGVMILMSCLELRTPKCLIFTNYRFLY